MPQAVRQLTQDEVLSHAVGAGFKGWFAITISCIAWAESRGNAWAIGLNAADPTSPAYLSLDLGVLQFNTYWNAMTTAQAFNPVWSFDRAFDKTSGGLRNLDLWSSHKSGAYRAFAHDFVVLARTLNFLT